MASGWLARKWLQDGVGSKALPKKWLQRGFPRSFKKLLQELHRKWLQEGFPGSGFRRASQEVALGGLPFSKWLQEGPRKWLQQGFPGSGFGCGVRSFLGSCFRSFPGIGFKRLPRKWAQELQEDSGSGFTRASQEVASGRLPRKWRQEASGASQEVASGKLPRKWAHDGFPGSGFKGFAGNGRASQEMCPGGFQKGFLMFFLTFFPSGLT